MAAFQPSSAHTDGAGSRLGGFSQASVSSEDAQSGGSGPSRRTLRRREYRQRQLLQPMPAPAAGSPTSPPPPPADPPLHTGSALSATASVGAQHVRSTAAAAGVSGSSPPAAAPARPATLPVRYDAATQTDLAGDIAAAASELMQLRASAARLEAGLGALHHAWSDNTLAGPHVFGAVVAELGRHAESGCQLIASHISRLEGFLEQSALAQAQVAAAVNNPLAPSAVTTALMRHINLVVTNRGVDDNTTIPDEVAQWRDKVERGGLRDADICALVDFLGKCWRNPPCPRFSP